MSKLEREADLLNLLGFRFYKNYGSVGQEVVSWPKLYPLTFAVV